MRWKNDQPGVWCMNRGWKFRKENISVLPEGREHDDIYDYAKAGGSKGPAELSYDDSGWADTVLPHDWVTAEPFMKEAALNHGYKERGTGWYRLKFSLPEEEKEKQICLQFEGLSSNAFIYINGILCKKQFYGYNSFEVDITDFVCFAPAVNILAVKIEAEGWEGWWYEGAGIYRNVWMVRRPPVHIAGQGVYVNPGYLGEGRWNVRAEVAVENSFPREGAVIVKNILYDGENVIGVFPEEEISLPAYGKKTCCKEFCVQDPELWDESSPKLYRLYTACVPAGAEAETGGGQDYRNTGFGFRTVSLDPDSGFLINGKAVKLKGVCCHQDHAGTGVAVPYAVKEYRIRKLKELGANAYRPAHNPDPEILDICDRLGMYVMQENRTFSSDEDTLRELRGIVRMTRNHPCAVMYSIFNEEPLQGTQRGARMAARMREAVRVLDDSRPVMAAFNGGYMDENGAVTALDAVGINYNPARYDGFHRKFPGIPLIASETASACMVRGEYRTDPDAHVIGGYDDFSVPWGSTHREAWHMAEERDFVAGAFVWTGFDYRGEPTPFRWPSAGSFFGIYDACGFPKEAVYLYQALWKKEPLVHITGPWASQKLPGAEVKLMVVSNCEQVDLYVNGVKRKLIRGGVYGQEPFSLPYEPGELKAVGSIGGKVCAEDVIRTAGNPYALQISADRQVIRGDGLDAVVICVRAVDGKGAPAPEADDLVHLDVDGCAELIGAGNGNPNSHEPDCAPYRRLFHGQAQFILRNSGAGLITVKARAEGLIPAELTILAEQGDYIPFLKTASDCMVGGWEMYSRLLDRHPGGEIKSEANDRNSYEPIEFHGRPQSVLTGQEGKYALYRTTIHIRRGERKALYFSEVKGRVWVYFNDRCVYERTEVTEGAVSAEIPAGMEGNVKCAVVIGNINSANSEAGICGSVIMAEV